MDDLTKGFLLGLATTLSGLVNRQEGELSAGQRRVLDQLTQDLEALGVPLKEADLSQLVDQAGLASREDVARLEERLASLEAGGAPKESS